MLFLYYFHFFQYHECFHKHIQLVTPSAFIVNKADPSEIGGWDSKHLRRHHYFSVCIFFLFTHYFILSLSWRCFLTFYCWDQVTFKCEGSGHSPPLRWGSTGRWISHIFQKLAMFYFRHADLLTMSSFTLKQVHWKVFAHENVTGARAGIFEHASIAFPSKSVIIGLLNINLYFVNHLQLEEILINNKCKFWKKKLNIRLSQIKVF